MRPVSARMVFDERDEVNRDALRLLPVNDMADPSETTSRDRGIDAASLSWSLLLKN